MSNESGRQATARAEAMKLLSTDHQIDWNDTGGYLALWFESGRSYTEALDWIKQGVLLPSDIVAAESGGLVVEPAVSDDPPVGDLTELSRAVRPNVTNSPKITQLAKPKRPVAKKKP